MIHLEAHIIILTGNAAADAIKPKQTDAKWIKNSSTNITSICLILVSTDSEDFR